MLSYQNFTSEVNVCFQYVNFNCLMYFITASPQCHIFFFQGPRNKLEVELCKICLRRSRSISLKWKIHIKMSSPQIKPVDFNGSQTEHVILFNVWQSYKKRVICKPLKTRTKCWGLQTYLLHSGFLCYKWGCFDIVGFVLSAWTYSHFYCIYIAMIELPLVTHH